MKKAFMILILTLFLLVTAGNVFCEEMAKDNVDLTMRHLVSVLVEIRDALNKRK